MGASRGHRSADAVANLRPSLSGLTDELYAAARHWAVLFRNFLDQNLDHELEVRRSGGTDQANERAQ